MDKTFHKYKLHLNYMTVVLAGEQFNIVVSTVNSDIVISFTCKK